MNIINPIYVIFLKLAFVVFQRALAEDKICEHCSLQKTHMTTATEKDLIPEHILHIAFNCLIGFCLFAYFFSLLNNYFSVPLFLP